MDALKKCASYCIHSDEQGDTINDQEATPPKANHLTQYDETEADRLVPPPVPVGIQANHTTSLSPEEKTRAAHFGILSFIAGSIGVSMIALEKNVTVSQFFEGLQCNMTDAVDFNYNYTVDFYHDSHNHPVPSET